MLPERGHNMSLLNGALAKNLFRSWKYCIQRERKEEEGKCNTFYKKPSQKFNYTYNNSIVNVPFLYC